MNIRSYQDLIVWQKAMDLCEGIYERTRNFPKEEIYGLTSQIRRAAVSVPSNIAEGHARGSGTDYRRFLFIAHGSLAETETQLILSQRLGYLKTDEADPLLSLAVEISKMLRSLEIRLGEGVRS